MVEPQPPTVAATVPVRGLKCRGGDAAAEPAMAGTPNRGQERGGEEGEEEEKAVLRRGLAAARARRKAGPVTPSPSWKLEASPPRPEEPVADSSAAAAVAGAMGRRSSAVAASARQLGATLWEIRDVIKVDGAGRRIRRRGRRGGVAGDDDEADRVRARRSFLPSGQHGDIIMVSPFFAHVCIFSVSFLFAGFCTASSRFTLATNYAKAMKVFLQLQNLIFWCSCKCCL